MKQRVRGLLVLFLAAGCALGMDVLFAGAGQIGHFNSNALSIRDLVMPSEKGFFTLVYNPYYDSNGFYSHGDKVKSIEAGRTVDLPHGGTIEFTAKADIDISVTAQGTSPTFVWSSGYKFLGADFLAMIAPYFGYQKVKVDAAVTLGGPGIILPGDIARVSVSKKDSASGMGDLYVQPLTLGWHNAKSDFTLYYGFYAPTGEFDHTDLANVGYGFWSHELNFASYYYLEKNKATALFLDVNYEYNSKKDGVDVTPGQNICLSYGVSQYLSEQLEIGVGGSSIFKVTGDTGSAARNKEASDYLHSAGVQVSYWFVKEKFYVSSRGAWEYATSGRTQGVLVSLNAAYAF